MIDQEGALKDFLLGAYKDVRDPDKYIKKQEADPIAAQMQQMGLGQEQKPNSPLAAIGGKTPLPQTL
jgi:hypothetical protein